MFLKHGISLFASVKNTISDNRGEFISSDSSDIIDVCAKFNITMKKLQQKNHGEMILVNVTMPFLQK